MTHPVSVLHEGGYVMLNVSGYVEPGESPTYNPPDEAYPGHPPQFIPDKIEIISDELNRGLDPDHIYEQHDEEIAEQFIEEENHHYP